MKIAGVDPKTFSNEHLLVLPRDNGKSQIVFRARGVEDFDEFETLCPKPQPPGKLTKDGFVPDEDEEGFKQILANYIKQRMAWMLVKTLEPSEIEWDTVKLDDPSTWKRWEEDLKSNKFSQAECNRISNLVMQANSLDESYLERAREVFLRGQGTPSGKSTGPNTEPNSTPSGEPAHD